MSDDSDFSGIDDNPSTKDKNQSSSSAKKKPSGAEGAHHVEEGEYNGVLTLVVHTAAGCSRQHNKPWGVIRARVGLESEWVYSSPFPTKVSGASKGPAVPLQRLVCKCDEDDEEKERLSVEEWFADAEPVSENMPAVGDPTVEEGFYFGGACYLDTTMDNFVFTGPQRNIPPSAKPYKLWKRKDEEGDDIDDDDMTFIDMLRRNIELVWLPGDVTVETFLAQDQTTEGGGKGEKVKGKKKKKKKKKSGGKGAKEESDEESEGDTEAEKSARDNKTQQQAENQKEQPSPPPQQQKEPSRATSSPKPQTSEKKAPEEKPSSRPKEEPSPPPEQQKAQAQKESEKKEDPVAADSAQKSKTAPSSQTAPAKDSKAQEPAAAKDEETPCLGTTSPPDGQCIEFTLKKISNIPVPGTIPMKVFCAVSLTVNGEELGDPILRTPVTQETNPAFDATVYVSLVNEKASKALKKLADQGGKLVVTLKLFENTTFSTKERGSCTSNFLFTGDPSGASRHETITGLTVESGEPACTADMHVNVWDAKTYQDTRKKMARVAIAKSLLTVRVQAGENLAPSPLENSYPGVPDGSFFVVVRPVSDSSSSSSSGGDGGGSSQRTYQIFRDRDGSPLWMSDLFFPVLKQLTILQFEVYGVFGESQVCLGVHRMDCTASLSSDTCTSGEKKDGSIPVADLPINTEQMRLVPPKSDWPLLHPFASDLAKANAALGKLLIEWKLEPEADVRDADRRKTQLYSQKLADVSPELTSPPVSSFFSHITTVVRKTSVIPTHRGPDTRSVILTARWSGGSQRSKVIPPGSGGGTDEASSQKEKTGDKQKKEEQKQDHKQQQRLLLFELVPSNRRHQIIFECTDANSQEFLGHALLELDMVDLLTEGQFVSRADKSKKGDDRKNQKKEQKGKADDGQGFREFSKNFVLALLPRDHDIDVRRSDILCLNRLHQPTFGSITVDCQFLVISECSTKHIFQLSEAFLRYAPTPVNSANNNSGETERTKTKPSDSSSGGKTEEEKEKMEKVFAQIYLGHTSDATENTITLKGAEPWLGFPPRFLIAKAGKKEDPLILSVLASPITAEQQQQQQPSNSTSEKSEDETANVATTTGSSGVRQFDLTHIQDQVGRIISRVRIEEAEIEVSFGLHWVQKGVQPTSPPETSASKKSTSKPASKEKTSTMAAGDASAGKKEESAPGLAPTASTTPPPSARDQSGTFSAAATTIPSHSFPINPFAWHMLFMEKNESWNTVKMLSADGTDGTLGQSSTSGNFSRKENEGPSSPPSGRRAENSSLSRSSTMKKSQSFRGKGESGKNKGGGEGESKFEVILEELPDRFSTASSESNNNNSRGKKSAGRTQKHGNSSGDSLQRAHFVVDLSSDQGVLVFSNTTRSRTELQLTTCKDQGWQRASLDMLQSHGDVTLGRGAIRACWGYGDLHRSKEEEFEFRKKEEALWRSQQQDDFTRPPRVRVPFVLHTAAGVDHEPPRVSGAALVSMGKDKAVLIGGVDELGQFQGAVSKYDSSKQRWDLSPEDKRRLPGAMREGHTAVKSSPTTILIYAGMGPGGFNPQCVTDEGYCIENGGGRGHVGFLNDLWEYHVPNNSWNLLSTEGLNRWGHAAVFARNPAFSTDSDQDDDGRLIVLGGWTVAVEETTTTIGRRQIKQFQPIERLCSEIALFSPTTRNWEYITPNGNTVPPARSGHSAILHEDNVYVFGGLGGAETDSTGNEYVKYYQDFYSLRLSSMQWMEVLQLGTIRPPAMHGHSATKTQINGESCMLLLGGQSEAQHSLECFMFCFSTGFWRRIKFHQCSAGIHSRLSAACCVVPPKALTTTTVGTTNGSRRTNNDYPQDNNSSPEEGKEPQKIFRILVVGGVELQPHVQNMPPRVPGTGTLTQSPIATCAPSQLIMVESPPPAAGEGGDTGASSSSFSAATVGLTRAAILRQRHRALQRETEAAEQNLLFDPNAQRSAAHVEKVVNRLAQRPASAAPASRKGADGKETPEAQKFTPEDQERFNKRLFYRVYRKQKPQRVQLAKKKGETPEGEGKTGQDEQGEAEEVDDHAEIAPVGQKKEPKRPPLSKEELQEHFQRVYYHAKERYAMARSYELHTYKAESAPAATTTAAATSGHKVLHKTDLKQVNNRMYYEPLEHHRDTASKEYQRYMDALKGSSRSTKFGSSARMRESVSRLHPRPPSPLSSQRK